MALTNTLLCYALLCFAYLIVLDIIRGEILHNLVIIVCCGRAETKETDFVDCIISPHSPIHQHGDVAFVSLMSSSARPTALLQIIILLCLLSFLFLDRAPCLVWVCQESLINAPDRCSSYLLMLVILFRSSSDPSTKHINKFYRIFFFVSIAVNKHGL